MATYFNNPYLAPGGLDPLGAALGQGMGQAINQWYQNKLVNQDIQKWQQYQSNMQAAQQAAKATGLPGVPNWPGAQPKIPQFQSQAGQQMALMMQNPLYQAQLEAQRARTAYWKRPAKLAKPKTERLVYKDAQGKMRVIRADENQIPEIVNKIIEAGGTIDISKSIKTEKLVYKDAQGKMRIARVPENKLSQTVDRIIKAGGTIDTSKSTLSDERLKLYQEAKARGDEKAAELALYGKPLVEVQFGKPAAAAERTKIAETRASIDALNNLKDLFDSSQTKTGPVVGRIAPTKGLLELTTDEQEAFMAATSAFKNKIIKEITGAQMSEVEAKRIMKQIPDITDPPTRWLAKWEQSKKNLEFLQKRRLEILQQSGLRVPGTEVQIEIPEDIQNMSDEELKELAGE